jgi:predicted transcriptional regulator of viral defense system
MDFWQESYYGALLTAAERHGAAHHRPQVFQVMLAQNRRPISCGKVRIEFYARQDMSETPWVEQNTARGVLRLSSPEATAFELVGYYDRCGGLDNVATILTELGERLDLAALRSEARRCPAAWTQRLGYLLDLVGEERAAGALRPFAAKATEVPLIRSRRRSNAPRDRCWKLILNTTVEADV